jgi:hypothetical protein
MHELHCMHMKQGLLAEVMIQDTCSSKTQRRRFSIIYERKKYSIMSDTHDSSCNQEDPRRSALASCVVVSGKQYVSPPL